MVQRREYPKIEIVEEYLLTRTLSPAEQNRIRCDVAEFLSVLAESGHTWPEESDYQAYMLLRQGKDKKPSTIQDRVRRIKKYYEWRQTNSMTETEKTSEQLNTPKEETGYHAEHEPERLAETSKPRRGRKPKAEKDRRSEKISVYLTPEIYASMKDLAHFSRQDISDIFFNLASEFVARNEEKLREFRDFLARAGTIK